jgi:hypothetical protein
MQVINQEDGTAEIEVFQEPLDFRGTPKKHLLQGEGFWYSIMVI